MAVSEGDKERMRRLRRDLAASERDERGTPEQRADTIRWLNERRKRRGLPALSTEAPEEGFYRYARALGMARIDRQDP